MIDLKAKPFDLTEKQSEKVQQIVQQLSLEEKIGQLFCLHGDYKDTDEIKQVIADYTPGAMMYRPGDSQQIQEIHRLIQENSKVPLLLAANLEAGGDGIGKDGTFFGRAIQVAAAEDEKHAYRLGKIAGAEGAAVGCNWAFAPVVDINLNFANPITNVRTFGSDVSRVKDLALQYIRGCQEEGVAVSIKHFPGDGVDDRDQHLLTSVNSLSTDEWDQTYGVVYRELIEAGAKTVMAGHIMQPAYSRKLRPGISDNEILPGSLSPELLQDLLRKELNFNGLIVTDATNMAGFSSCGKRKELLPQAIAAGCDMLLFTRNLAEDYASVLEGYHSGIISAERLEEAVLRILATKASLGLLDKEQLVPDKDALSVLRCDQHRRWAYELADESITLVKDTQNLLPLTSADYKKVLVIVLGDVVSASGKPPVSQSFIQHLRAEGFEPTIFQKELHGDLLTKAPVEELTAQFDLVLYFANIKTASNQTTVRINWLAPMGVDVPWFVEEIPTMFISIANPYHLQDVPMIKTYINAYTANEFNPKVLVEKLVGKSPFKGINPIDPFCGYWDTKQ
ncbi:glycoside hydrolase family 3 protein [Enterococcus sp. 669A]|uniref:beta-N-acetylhexosaminidase n=1 Tax=Candidatus Enterococcus moelleringii TaxID=2815325 RepID=A0ABS3L9G0_9ENTE|nr:glycoside hydrolase family 3 protein [Enterococcus sp. 669A]MBO1305703.1 glycoside hydrolase family 3 protein [Enterococcus sp. 669A]